MKKILRNLDKPLLLISTILFVIGLIMIFSASNVTAYMKYSASPYRYFMKQSVFLFMSIVASFIIIKFKTSSYKLTMNVLVYVVMGMLAFVYFYGTVKNNSIRWIDLGFFNIQPSEFAKVIIILWLASFFDTNKKELDRYGPVFYALGVSIAIAIFIFISPDLDTTFIYAVTVMLLFFMSPISKEIKSKFLFLIGGALIVGILTLLTTGGNFLTKGQNKRLGNYHNPCSHEKYYTTGNQVCNGYIAINNGGLKGVGLGNSTQKYLYLPEAHTDYIFAIIMEELGLVGAGVIFVLYFILVGRIIKIAKDSYTTRGFLICMGIAIYIVLHIVVNLGGMFGLMPATGVPLPFMSYGGSFCMCLVFALTVVQRVNVENKFKKEREKEKKA